MQEVPKQSQAFNIGLMTETSAKNQVHLGQIVFIELDFFTGWLLKSLALNYEPSHINFLCQGHFICPNGHEGVNFRKKKLLD